MERAALFSKVGWVEMPSLPTAKHCPRVDGLVLVMYWDARGRLNFTSISSLEVVVLPWCGVVGTALAG